MAAAAFCSQALILIVLHVVPSGYDPAVNFVSEYAVGEFALLGKAFGFTGVVGIVALCGALHASRIAPLGSPVNMLMVLASIAATLVALFPVDPVAAAFQGGGAPRFTPAGWIHVLSGIVWAVAVLVLMGGITQRLRRSRSLSNGFQVLIPLTGISILAYAAMLMTRPATYPAGLLQRVFVVGTLAWLILVSIGMATGRLDGQAVQRKDQ